MEIEFSEERYDDMLGKLFVRFPSFQKAGASAYKPGIANMEFVDQLMGHPHRSYDIIHVAGTNGKGSVSNMLASALSACGLKVGLYTSPHILDFRERMRVIEISSRASLGRDDSDDLRGLDDTTVISSEPARRVEKSLSRCISKEYVYDFVSRWQDTFDHLDLSFFEITTMMALRWFADEKVGVVVLETGLGGRLDSTNIVTPVLSVITNIGLDHCDMLGDTLAEIAFEKAGIIKPLVPVVIGESHPETDTVFERKVLYTNLPEPSFMGNRSQMMSLLTFADKIEPMLWSEHESILARMDLQGAYQRKNLRTVLAALTVLQGTCSKMGTKVLQVPLGNSAPVALLPSNCDRCICEALINTAKRTDFHGRWEKISDNPLTICDIGHNEHGLRHNFAQLSSMLEKGECSDLIMVYGSVADKDVDAVLHLFPENAVCIFTQAQSKRALPACKIKEKYLEFCTETARDVRQVYVRDNVHEAVELAKDVAAGMTAVDPSARPLVYIGGSTYVVSEAVSLTL